MPHGRGGFVTTDGAASGPEEPRRGAVRSPAITLIVDGGMTVTHGRIVIPLVLAVPLFAAPVALAANADTQAPEGSFRGMYVCQKLKVSPDILRAPIDMTVQGAKVEFARPLFNWNGKRVVGSEMASGSIAPDGKMHLTSGWINRGVAFQADYTGTLSPTGGTFIGTQKWQANGLSGSRTCTAALVRTESADQHAEQAQPAEQEQPAGQAPTPKQ